jgi:hypothetical protein
MEKIHLQNSPQKYFHREMGKTSEPGNFIVELGNYFRTVVEYLHFSTHIFNRSSFAAVKAAKDDRLKI